MPDFNLMPLEQLIHACPPLLQVNTRFDRGAWQALQHRALIDQNPVAWDALVGRLWPSLLFWIYAHAPETTPAVADILAMRAIGEFQRQQPYPLSHATLIAQLQQTVIRLLDISVKS